nr:hypothetical protein [Cylindrospermopsis raciborskii]
MKTAVILHSLPGDCLWGRPGINGNDFVSDQRFVVFLWKFY